MRKRPARLLLRLVVAAFALALSFPFYWMALTSFKRTSDLYDLKNNPLLFNEPPTLEHWRFLFAETLYPRWLANTMLVGLAVVAITLLLAVPAAYGLARLTGRWGERAGIGMFLMYLVPPTLLFIPMSRVVAILRPSGLALVADPRLPDVHRPVRDLAAHGLLQEHSARPRGRGHGRRSVPFLGVPPGDRARLVFGTGHRLHLRLHARAPGVRLRPDVSLVRLQADRRRRRPDLPDARRRLTTGASSWRPASSPAFRSRSSTTSSSTG